MNYQLNFDSTSIDIKLINAQKTVKTVWKTGYIDENGKPRILESAPYRVRLQEGVEKAASADDVDLLIPVRDTIQVVNLGKDRVMEINVAGLKKRVTPSDHQMTGMHFLARSEIEPQYYNGSHYFVDLQKQKESDVHSQIQYLTLHHLLKSNDWVMMTRYTFRNCVKHAVIYPAANDLLRLSELVYVDRLAEPIATPVKIPSVFKSVDPEIRGDDFEVSDAYVLRSVCQDISGETISQLIDQMIQEKIENLGVGKRRATRGGDYELPRTRSRRAAATDNVY